MDHEEDDRTFSVVRERIRQIEKKALRALHGTKQRKTAPQGRYRFHPLEARHLTLISLWLGRPHVAQWWSDPEKQIEKLRRNLVDQSFEALIMLLEDRPGG